MPYIWIDDDEEGDEISIATNSKVAVAAVKKPTKKPTKDPFDPFRGFFCFVSLHFCSHHNITFITLKSILANLFVPTGNDDLSLPKGMFSLSQIFDSLPPSLPNLSHQFSRSFLQANTPQATVQKIVTEILPASSGLAFGKDARDLLIECCVEFITLISSEANEISEKESKKTIACEHITKALEALGFGEYVQGILEVASEHKEQLKVRLEVFLLPH